MGTCCFAAGGDPHPAGAMGRGLGVELCLWEVFQALSAPLASRKIKHLYLRRGFVLEAVLPTSRLLIPTCSKAYGAELS